MLKSESLTRLLQGGVLLVVVTLAGCSGAGVAPGDITTSPVQQLAADQLTCLQLVRTWLGVTYPASNALGPDKPHSVIERFPWGKRISGTDTYGQTFKYFLYSDGHGQGRWGTTAQKQLQATWTSATLETQPDGRRRYTQHLRHRFADLTIASRATVTQPPAGQTGLAIDRRDGTLTLSDGRTLSFSSDRDPLGYDVLELRLPGEKLTVRLAVPIEFVTNIGWLPPVQSQARAQVQVGSRSLTLTLTGRRQSWQELTVRGEDGTTGSFTLGNSLAGFGSFRQGGAVLGVLDWTDELSAHLTLTGQSQADLSPAAAARDFALEHWIGRLADLGASPAL